MKSRNLLYCLEVVSDLPEKDIRSDIEYILSMPVPVGSGQYEVVKVGKGVVVETKAPPSKEVKARGRKKAV